MAYTMQFGSFSEPLAVAHEAERARADKLAALLGAERGRAERALAEERARGEQLLAKERARGERLLAKERERAREELAASAEREEAAAAQANAAREELFLDLCEAEARANELQLRADVQDGQLVARAEALASLKAAHAEREAAWASETAALTSLLEEARSRAKGATELEGARRQLCAFEAERNAAAAARIKLEAALKEAAAWREAAQADAQRVARRLKLAAEELARERATVKAQDSDLALAAAQNECLQAKLESDVAATQALLQVSQAIQARIDAAERDAGKLKEERELAQDEAALFRRRCEKLAKVASTMAHGLAEGESVRRYFHYRLRDLREALCRDDLRAVTRLIDQYFMELPGGRNEMQVYVEAHVSGVLEDMNLSAQIAAALGYDCPAPESMLLRLLMSDEKHRFYVMGSEERQQQQLMSLLIERDGLGVVVSPPEPQAIRVK